MTLQIVTGTTGQTTLTARLILGGAYVGTAIALSETPSLSGAYSAAVPNGTGAGEYVVIFLNGSQVIGSGTLSWNGTSENTLSSTRTQLSAIPTNPLLTSDSRLNNLNAPIADLPTLTQIEASTIIAKEATSGTINTRVQSIPTNPLLTNDSRLNNLNAPIADRPTLTQIEASTVLAKEATSGTINTKVQAIPSNPLLTNDSRLNNLNAPIADRPTLSQIEGSTALAKASDVTALSTQIGDPLQFNEYTTPPNTASIVTALTPSFTSLSNQIGDPLQFNEYTTPPNTTSIVNALSGSFQTLSTQIGSPVQTNNTNITTIPQILTGVSNLLKVRIPASGQSVSVKAPTISSPGYVRTSDNTIDLEWTVDNSGVETLTG